MIFVHFVQLTVLLNIIISSKLNYACALFFRSNHFGPNGDYGIWALQHKGFMCVLFIGHVSVYHSEIGLQKVLIDSSLNKLGP